MKLVLVFVLKLTFFLPWNILGLVFVSPVIWLPLPCFNSLPDLIVLCRGGHHHCSPSFQNVQRWWKKTFRKKLFFLLFFPPLCSSYPFNYCGWSVKFCDDVKMLSLGDRWSSSLEISLFSFIPSGKERTLRATSDFQLIFVWSTIQCLSICTHFPWTLIWHGPSLPDLFRV